MERGVQSPQTGSRLSTDEQKGGWAEASITIKIRFSVNASKYIPEKGRLNWEQSEGRGGPWVVVVRDSDLSLSAGAASCRHWVTVIMNSEPLCVIHLFFISRREAAKEECL